VQIKREKILVGWREWISFPALNIPALKIKIDTGARTSALHAFKIETFEEEGKRMVRFGIHPLQMRKDIEMFCTAEILDERIVSDSGGHREKRIVIKTPVQLGDNRWDIEFTLTDRDTMRFRALLGRTAMQGRLIVDPDTSYLTGMAIKENYIKDLKRREQK